MCSCGRRERSAHSLPVPEGSRFEIRPRTAPGDSAARPVRSPNLISALPLSTIRYPLSTIHSSYV